LDQLRHRFPATAKLLALTLTLVIHFRDGLPDAVTIPCRNTRVVTIDCERNVGEPSSDCMGSSSRPVIDTANGRIPKSGLETLGILSQVMHQTRHLRLISEAERLTESSSQGRHLAKVVGQRLPAARVRVRPAIRQGGCMRVKIHGPTRIEASTPFPQVYLREILSGRLGQKLS
jgi:hypothetical protein